jgi:hypothetical protein
MSKVQLQGNVSGTGVFTIASPNSNTDRTLTLPDNSGTVLTQNSQPSFVSTIGVGGATPAASGAGITFPATQSASSDANTLDDYEEGTWSPVLRYSTNISATGVLPSTVTLTNRGRYRKIGSLVYVCVEIVYADVGAQFIVDTIEGLPFTAAVGSSAQALAYSPYGCSGRYGGTTDNKAFGNSAIGSGVSNIYCGVANENGGFYTLVISGFSVFRVAGCYIAS